MNTDKFSDVPRDLTQLDPEWAWAAFEPSDRRPWNHRLAAHLYRRAAFGSNRAELDAAVATTPGATIELLDSGNADADRLDRESDELARTLTSLGNPRALSSWWLWRMHNSRRPLVEKATLFWHGHFATSAEKVTDPRLMLDQNELLRRHALGPFEPLVQAVSRDPAMLLYLDSASNRKRHPNENYARELMELFCLGPGNYTEKDIQQLARCFTGWEVRDGAFRFNDREHDFGTKTVLGQSGPLRGEDAVRIVVAQSATPDFIVRKVIKFFLFDEPEPPAALVASLARDYRQHNLDTGYLVRRVLSSNLFFSPLAIGRKVRSPLELGIGLLKSLEGTCNFNSLAETLDLLGQAVFFPPNVKGWDGGRAWLNSSTLLGRTNLVLRMVQGGKYQLAGGDLAALATRHKLGSAAQCVDWLLDQLMAVDVPPAVRAHLVAQCGAGVPSNRGMGELIHAISALPEFQLS